MNNVDLVRLVDSISRDKNIEKELLFEDLETAMASAARKTYGEDGDVRVKIDRMSGMIEATVDGVSVELDQLGRIAAQTAKQVIIQRIREAERSSIFEEYSERVGQIVAGTVSRYEGGAVTVNLGRAEGYFPRSELIPGETHHPGERIRGMILDVREAPYQVKIMLTRTHPDYIRRLFELEVPEVAERVIEIKALAREAGYRTKVAVASIDTKVDAVGACVGVRGSRIRNVVDELGGEKIDIVRWNESSQILIGNALKPAEVQEVALCFELGRSIVVVAEDQLSLAIGKRGQNVRLAARLTGWDIDILTPAEYNKGLDDLERTLKAVEGIEDVVLDKILALGMVSLGDVKEVGAEPLVNELELTDELAERIVASAKEGLERIAAEAEAAKVAEAEAAEVAKAAEEEAAKAEAAEQVGTEPGEDGETVAEGAEESADTATEPSVSEEQEASTSVVEAASDDSDAGEDADAETEAAELDESESDSTAEAADGAVAESSVDGSDVTEPSPAEQEGA